MKPKLPLVVVLATSLLGTATEEPLVLAREGRTTYQIVLPADAIASERHAAVELADFLKQSTGAGFPVVSEPEAGDGPSLMVGFGQKARALVPDRKVGDFGPEELPVRRRY